MLRAIYRFAVVAVVALCVAPAAHADSHDNPDGYYYGWARTFTLTPLEHKRLRAYGLNDDEVFAVANVARSSGVYVTDAVHAIQRGETARTLARRYNLSVDTVTAVRPEWKTPAWQEAVERGDYFWIPSRAMSGSMAPTRPSSERR